MKTDVASVLECLHVVECAHVSHVLCTLDMCLASVISAKCPKWIDFI